ncbi:DUF6624 domain-containing protein [Pseudoxanthomonas sp.]|uniref:DUF6624 domain-containing protein n=1 Tax=Pseudoxanthomonas sp. TaxID=1871049 RepID=UPI002606D26E|nr:DUF6624 domain-containing protein [Pseudoxanthomonas sp.]WDS35135.1 MAG: hypothetical protein O8I58_12270 [Pseudoxanthomonas sp.]
MGAASCLARAGEHDAAFARLQRTDYKDRPSIEIIANDADLASLHDDPRWRAWLDAERKAQAARGYDPVLAKELAERTTRDQAIREQVMVRPRDVKLNQQALEIDRDNTGWLKSVVDRQGWPLVRQVGSEGANQAWLLAQHADADPAFQERVLGLMQSAVAQGEASGSDLAYMTDRVRRAQGKRQVYGTQFQQVDGMLQIQPVEDLDGLDARRAAIGLESMADYVAQGERQMHRKIQWPPASEPAN